MKLAIAPDFLDRYSRLDSPVHRQPAWLKLLATVTLVGVIIAVPPRWVWAFPAIAAALLAIMLLSRVPAGFVLRRLLLLEPFVISVAILALFQEGGLRAFALLVLRSTLCLLAMIILANTTPFADLLRVLRRARVPGILVTTLALMYRYLFVLIDESQRMRRARLSRTFTPGRTAAWRSLSTVVAQLFVRSSQRAERIYAAMCARGWR